MSSLLWVGERRDDIYGVKEVERGEEGEMGAG